MFLQGEGGIHGEGIFSFECQLHGGIVRVYYGWKKLRIGKCLNQMLLQCHIGQRNSRKCKLPVPRWLFDFRLSVLSNSRIMAMRQDDPKHKILKNREGESMNHSLPDSEILYSALVNRDSNFEGIFVVGVKTTGIFCRPTCTARKPKRANVEFFASAHDALLAGYRPCKVCTPLEYKGAAPDWLKPLLAEINDNPLIRLRDSDLRARGLDPSRVSYWFKRHHEMTFQAYLRALRIGQAFGRIKHGESVTRTALESGYESLSGFADSFKRTAGFSPNKSQESQLIVTTRILTPLGPMLAGATDDGICLLEFVDRRMLETQLKRLSKLLNAECAPGFCKHFDKLSSELEEYFSGKRREFDVPLVLPGTPFQQRVWTALQTIPYGSTRSYKEQAQTIGLPSAIRAVAKANGDNRIAIIIPCHRVIGADGNLTGYGGGLWRKRYLLNLESSHGPR
jgi:AraC family transcriptional regulator of adaptative response/methylated-DNA-[protein]-cysteine methyltransferase